MDNDTKNKVQSVANKIETGNKTLYYTRELKIFRHIKPFGPFRQTINDPNKRGLDHPKIKCPLLLYFHV